MAVGVEEEMPILELAFTVRIEVPEEDAMLKGSVAPLLWRLKVTVEELALTPKTVPLLMSLPVVKELEPFQMASKPAVPEPDRAVPPRAMVICPGVVVVMVMLEPATKLVGAYLVPVPSAARSWPVTVGAVEVPVPPLVAAKTPETSEEPKAMAPLNNAPPDVDLTGRAWVKEDKVAEPLAATVK